MTISEYMLNLSLTFLVILTTGVAAGVLYAVVSIWRQLQAWSDNSKPAAVTLSEDTVTRRKFTYECFLERYPDHKLKGDHYPSSYVLISNCVGSKRIGSTLLTALKKIYGSDAVNLTADDELPDKFNRNCFKIFSELVYNGRSDFSVDFPWTLVPIIGESFVIITTGDNDGRAIERVVDSADLEETAPHALYNKAHRDETVRQFYGILALKSLLGR